MTALFSAESATADAVVSAGRCILAFDEGSQSYRIPCAASELDVDDPAYQATYWHNRMFNPNLPGGIQILSFAPDWIHSVAYRVNLDVAK